MKQKQNVGLFCRRMRPTMCRLPIFGLIANIYFPGGSKGNIRKKRVTVKINLATGLSFHSYKELKYTLVHNL